MAITRIPPGLEEDGDLQQPQPIHPPHALHGPSLSNASTATVDIEAWTVAALESLSIAPIARGTGSALSIPLDFDHQVREPRDDNGAAARMKLRGVAFDGATDDAYGASITPPRRPPSSRDSMRRREALLKGKEGSRQRRRWENDRLLHVPNVQPPLPSDWQIHPTHRVLPPVPYQLAQYWDNKGFRERADHRNHPKKMATTTTTTTGGVAGMPPPPSSSSVGHVPRDLRATAKRTPAVKSWLRVLEEPVRQFVLERGLAVAAPTPAAAAAATAKQQREREEGRDTNDDSSDETDPEDEEIVFVGRNGRMRDGKPWKTARRLGQGQQQQQEEEEGELGMVLDVMEDEAGGAFKRWLTHSISDYYGLDSKSVMVGNPARRVVYIGAKQQQQQQQQRHGPRHKSLISRPVLPPPLWGML